MESRDEQLKQKKKEQQHNDLKQSLEGQRRQKQMEKQNNNAINIDFQRIAQQKHAIDMQKEREDSSRRNLM